eukprot:363670-Chlamydomonas_euryale.AAC.29
MHGWVHQLPAARCPPSAPAVGRAVLVDVDAQRRKNLRAGARRLSRCLPMRCAASVCAACPLSPAQPCSSTRAQTHPAPPPPFQAAAGDNLRSSPDSWPHQHRTFCSSTSCSRIAHRTSV